MKLESASIFMLNRKIFCCIPEYINLRGATHEQLKEFAKFVSPFTERPSKHYLTYKATKTYQFVFFDIETKSIGKNAEMCQLSAVTGNGKTYQSTFIMPNGSVSPSASRVNKLTVENVNCKRTLCKNSYLVSTASLQVALKSFSTILHHAIKFRETNKTTLPLIRSLLQRNRSPLQQTNGELCKANQSSVYHSVLVSTII